MTFVSSSTLPYSGKSMMKTGARLMLGVSSFACIATAAPAAASVLDRSTDFQSLAVSSLAGEAAQPQVKFAAAPLSQVQAVLQNVADAPVLSLGLMGSDDQVQRGTAARFLGYSNYPAFVVRAELRIYEEGSDLSQSPHAVIPADENGIMTWTPSTYAGERMKAVYRVYDQNGNFDQTVAQPLTVLAAAQVMQRSTPNRADFGVTDSAAQRNISLADARQANISAIADAGVDAIRVSGQIVPHDPVSGSLFTRQLVPQDCTAIAMSAQVGCAVTQMMQPIEGETSNSQAGRRDGLTVEIDKPEERVETEAVGFDPAIEVRSDERRVEPVLAVGLAESDRLVVRGSAATFVGYTNYPSLIAKSEVRIFRAGQSTTANPVATIALNKKGAARWAVDTNAPERMFYVLRVYNSDGRFDETAPHELIAVDKLPEGHEPPARPLFGTQDEAALRMIGTGGSATVTVTGRAPADITAVTVGKQVVPVDEDGKWVSEQIVAEDTRSIAIVMGEGQRVRYAATRDVSFDKEDWFIVGQGEVTIGTSFSSGPAQDVSGSTLADGDYAIGRAAFYAKGPIGDDWKLTAALDTGEALVQDLLSNLDRKDPRQLLRRLNSEQFYPTYGDDSTLVEDAPTQGRFYVRADNGTSQAIIGNFIAQSTGAELAQLDRGLFGALIDLKTAETTSFGEREAQVIAFASDPGTVPAREEFRGTGGSLYFLERQDVSIGSERLRVEIRDRETGLVIETQDLFPREDYDFDPFNGRITLLRPLPTVASTGRTVREGSSAGNIPVLVVRYEYTPAVGSLDGYTIGGRGTAWVGDMVRFGVTAQRDTVAEADQTLLGADATVRFGAGTYVKAELAQTDGVGFAQANSIDGGLSFSDFAAPNSGGQAHAWRAEAAIDLGDLSGKQGDAGTVNAFYENLERGFSSAGRLTPNATERWGLAANIAIGKTGRVAASFDQIDIEGRGASSTGEVDVENKFVTNAGTLTASVGLRHDDSAAGAVPSALGNIVQDGARTDAGVEFAFQPAGSTWTLHGFGQATLDRDATRTRNNRAGAGATAQITDRLSLKSEISAGDGGLGADVLVSHRLGEGAETYVGYTLLADRTDTGLAPQNLFSGDRGGAFVVGSRQRFTDSLSVFGENRIGVGSDVDSIARSFGLNFTPDEHLSASATFENGRIEDPANGVFERTAGSLSLGYTTEDVRAGTAIEVRREEGAAGSQTVWLSRSNLSYAVNPDWRFVSQFNLARADADGTSIRAAEFTEAIAGFAWRPVNNEAVNGLIRFQYFEDLGPVGQITGSGQTESPKQVSTIFSADFNFDLSEKLTLGTRYGYRGGRVSLARNSDEFVSSDAHLAVVRADYNVLREWDVLVEGRALWVTQADDLRLGALAGVYRHIGDHVKVGAGYSWSDFSDDLTDQSYSSHGPFLNILGRF